MKRMLWVLPLLLCLGGIVSADSLSGFAGICKSTGKVCANQLPAFKATNGIAYVGTGSTTSTVTGTGIWAGSGLTTSTATGTSSQSGSSFTGTGTSTATTTSTATGGPARTAIITITNIFTHTLTSTVIQTVSITGTGTATATGSGTGTGTVSGTATKTAVVSSTWTASQTASTTATWTKTQSLTGTGTITFTVTATAVIGVGMTSTSTSSLSATADATGTASSTWTNTALTTATTTTLATTVTISQTPDHTNAPKPDDVTASVGYVGLCSDSGHVHAAPPVMGGDRFIYAGTGDAEACGNVGFGFVPNAAGYVCDPNIDLSGVPTTVTPVKLFSNAVPMLYNLNPVYAYGFPGDQSWGPTGSSTRIANGVTWLPPSTFRADLWLQTTATAQIYLFYETCDSTSTPTALIVQSQFYIVNTAWESVHVETPLPSGYTIPAGEYLCVQVVAHTDAGTPTVSLGGGLGGRWSKINGPFAR